jgi:hypothetical protein
MGGQGEHFWVRIPQTKSGKNMFTHIAQIGGLEMSDSYIMSVLASHSTAHVGTLSFISLNCSCTQSNSVHNQ